MYKLDFYMTQRHKIQLFEDKKVRTAWDDEREEWYFSIVDVCAVLSESENPQTYWRVLKNRLKKEGNETVTNCNALKGIRGAGTFIHPRHTVYSLKQIA